MTKNAVAEHGPHAWDRQPGETPTAYAAFTRYRDMGADDRSLDAVSVALYGERRGNGRGPVRRILRWSTRYHWEERAEAWDSFVDVQDREQARRDWMSACSEAQQRLETLHSVAGSRLIDSLPRMIKDLSKQQCEMLAAKFRKTMVVLPMELREKYAAAVRDPGGIRAGLRPGASEPGSRRRISPLIKWGDGWLPIRPSRRVRSRLSGAACPMPEMYAAVLEVLAAYQNNPTPADSEPVRSIEPSTFAR